MFDSAETAVFQEILGYADFAIPRRTHLSLLGAVQNQAQPRRTPVSANR